MKSIKLSSFAMENIKVMSRAQVRSIGEAISTLQADGIHTTALEITRLPSKQGYVVRAKSGTRLTVLHEGGGHLLVDDVFLSEPELAAKKTASARSRSVIRNVIGSTVTGSPSRGQTRTATHKNMPTTKLAAKKDAEAKAA